MPTRRPKANAALLRGVYEDNLGLTKSSSRTRSKEDLGPGWGNRIFFLAALVVTIFGGIGPSTSQLEPVAPVTTEEQIEQRFGAEDDPGLQLSADADVSLASVFGLGIRTIILDPGHGGRDPGAVGPSGLTEKVIALDVSRRLERRLTAHGFQVRLTRRTDVSMTIKERVKFAVEENADILISIHVNALVSSPRSVVETFYFSPRGSETTERLARRENVNSGYTIANWRSSVRELANTVKQEESQRLAKSVQTELYETVRQFSPTVEDWGTKGGPFAVLSDRWRFEEGPAALAIPSILTEISVINYRHDEALLESDEFREAIAGALFEGIIRFVSSPDTGVAEDHENAPRDAVAVATESQVAQGQNDTK